MISEAGVPHEPKGRAPDESFPHFHDSNPIPVANPASHYLDNNRVWSINLTSFDKWWIVLYMYTDDAVAGGEHACR